MRLWSHLAAKGLFYWLRASAVLLLAVFVIEPLFLKYVPLTAFRYHLFQQFSQLAPRALEPRFVKVIEIGDQEYWRGPLAHRSPTKRDYIAKLVRALDRNDVGLIAIDFDMQLDPSAKGTPGDYDEVPEDYRTETAILIRTIDDVAQRRKVILSRNIDFAPNGGYRLVADTFQVYGLCTGMDRAGRWLNPGTPEFPLKDHAPRNIRCGYIALPYDMRRVPPPLGLENGQALDSFSTAIARATDPIVTAESAKDSYYGSYIPEQTLERYKATVSASDLLSSSPDLADSLQGKIAIIGAAWHLGGFGEGVPVDQHETPVGAVNGAVIHADFAEAILDSRTYGYVPDWILQVLELGFSVAAAVLFALVDNAWTKLGALAGIIALLAATQWLMLIAVGTFFEAFIPILGLWLHSIAERLAG